MTFIAEFESNDPDVDLQQIWEVGDFEPKDLIKMCDRRGYYTDVTIHTEQGL